MSSAGSSAGCRDLAGEQKPPERRETPLLREDADSCLVLHRRQPTISRPELTASIVKRSGEMECVRGLESRTGSDIGGPVEDIMAHLEDMQGVELSSVCLNQTLIACP